jgi:amino acid transporter
MAVTESPSRKHDPNAQPKLRRALNLPLLVLYGLGTTIGAGIYVLVGAAAGRAGIYAPVAFIAAAIAVAPTAASYGELAARFPVSAGEAAYVRHGFRSRSMSMLAGWLVIISGVIASATIAIGCAGYLRSFIDLPIPVLSAAVVVLMGLVAAWGIKESVLLAALLTLIEVGGLVFLIGTGFLLGGDLVTRIPETLPPVGDMAIWIGIANAGLLAVFAYIGFEDMVNVAEETKNPRRTMPWGIFLTLATTTVLYTLVTIVAVLAVPPDELAASEAPLSLVYHNLTGASPAFIGVIAVFATMNTILVLLIMASRVVYGMANQDTLPAFLARVNPTTKTPIIATFLIAAAVTVLAIGNPLERLADLASQTILVIWALVNCALLFIKFRREPADESVFVVPTIVPVAGVIFSLGLLLVSNLT